MLFWLQEFDQETEDSCEEVGLVHPFPLCASLSLNVFFLLNYRIYWTREMGRWVFSSFFLTNLLTYVSFFCPSE
jgi:hypothetical protein